MDEFGVLRQFWPRKTLRRGRSKKVVQTQIKIVIEFIWEGGLVSEP